MWEMLYYWRERLERMVTIGDLHQLHIFTNAAIDSGASPSVDEVEDAASEGRIIEYLDHEHDAFEEVGSPDDFVDREAVNELFASYWVPHPNDLMVEDNGLVLLSSMTFEVLSSDIWDVSTANPDIGGVLDMESED